LIIVDAQGGFTHPEGSLARVFGDEEIRPSMLAMASLRAAIRRARSSGIGIVLVRSEYRAGQFTLGRLDDPMAYLCVPGATRDSDWAEGIDPAVAEHVVTKRDMDAMLSSDYRDVVSRAIDGGVRTLCFAGFQLTTCVKATALSTHRAFAMSGVRSVVFQSLVGARASSYRAAPGAPSRVADACSELRKAGVEVVDGPDGW